MSEEEREQGWGLALAFDTDDEEFCRGVEAGCLYERLQHDPHTVRQQVHGNNAEMVVRIGEATGRHVRVLSDVDDWLDVEYAPASDPLQ